MYMSHCNCYANIGDFGVFTEFISLEITFSLLCKSRGDFRPYTESFCHQTIRSLLCQGDSRSIGTII